MCVYTARAHAGVSVSSKCVCVCVYQASMRVCMCVRGGKRERVCVYTACARVGGQCAGRSGTRFAGLRNHAPGSGLYPLKDHKLGKDLIRFP